MGLCINTAIRYDVETSPVYLNDVPNEASGDTYIDKILDFLRLLRTFDSYWQDREDDIPRVVEVNKSDILDYLDKNSDSVYKETLEYILQISDENNDFIHLEIS